MSKERLCQCVPHAPAFVTTSAGEPHVFCVVVTRASVFTPGRSYTLCRGQFSRVALVRAWRALVNVFLRVVSAACVYCSCRSSTRNRVLVRKARFVLRLQGCVTCVPCLVVAALRCVATVAPNSKH